MSDEKWERLERAENRVLWLEQENDRLRELLKECAGHFSFLRANGVFVWPNHPENPELKIAKALQVKL